jgi:two-component system cell cycle response regulator CpdR
LASLGRPRFGARITEEISGDAASQQRKERDVMKSEAGREMARGQGNMASILVAEDDQAVRDFVSRALAYYGHDVTTVADGSAALAALAERQFDLMLTDIVMPGLDGIALAAQAIKDNPTMSVLMMTGFASEGQRAQAPHVAVERVISKPFSLKEICAAVDEALQKRRGRVH